MSNPILGVGDGYPNAYKLEERILKMRKDTELINTAVFEFSSLVFPTTYETSVIIPI